MATEVFSAAELARLRSWPSELGPTELIRFFTLTEDDLAWLAGSLRGDANRFGVAVQLCTLPWLGFVPDDVAAAPTSAVARMASQLGVPASCLEGYGARSQTRTEHLRLVAARLGWRTAGAGEWKDIAEFLLARAVEHDTPSLLFGLACEFAASARIVRPGPVPLLRAVSTAREQATSEIYWRVEPLLGETRRHELDALLAVVEPLPVSRLAWLHQGATSTSPMAIRAELDKLRFLRGLDAHQLDLSMLPVTTRCRLAGIGRRARNQALTRRDETTRYPVLLATIAECAVEVLDEVVGMFDLAVSGVENRARRKLDELLATRAKASETRLELLEEILAVATDREVPDAEVGPRLRAADGPVGLSRMTAARREARDRLPRDHGHLEMIDASFTYLREFVPHVIAAITFTTSSTTPTDTDNPGSEAGPVGGSGGGPGEVVAAVGLLRELYARGGRKVPEDAPTGFVATRWRGYLEAATAAGNATAYRHYWELCTLLALRDGLRSGDVWVPGSRRYGDPAAHLIDPGRWDGLRREYAALVNAPLDVDDALGRLQQALHAGLGGLEAVLVAGEGPVRVAETGQLSLSRLAADTVPDVVAELRGQLVALLPRPQLTELLIEVDRWAGWSDKITHAGGKTHRGAQGGEALRRQLYAAVLAHACNLGLTGMAEASGLSYDTLAWTSEWYLREDTPRAANTAIVNQHHRLPLAAVWGGGTMSSSDGQRFPAKGKSLTARAMSRYFVDEGISTYTHVSDQHSTYGTKVIPATDREAVYVLDEILGNDTELPIAEHATDTAGQTLTVFALFALTGYTLSPRIRDLGGITLYRLESRPVLAAAFPHAGLLCTGAVDVALIRAQWDQMLRLAASLKYGHVSASLVVAKLHAAGRRSKLAQALVEYGGLVRTVFALRYLADDAYRRRIGRQLNKGESLHALRRDLFFAHDGAVRRRHREAQTGQAMCLSLVVNAIVCWNTAYLELALERLVAARGRIDPGLLGHISPAMLEHVNPYGTYEFPIATEDARSGYRRCGPPAPSREVLDCTPGRGSAGGRFSSVGPLLVLARRP